MGKVGTMSEIIKILCVDDERNVLKSLQRVFMDEDDYEILVAESGEEGLEVLKEVSDIAVIISDYRMPGMDGVDFLSQVYEHWPDTIRIVLSGFADTAMVVEAINLSHIFKFVPKPWNDEELKVTVTMGLQHRGLKLQNDRLNDELQEKNNELKELNDTLEKKVQQRTKALEIRNQILSVSQGVLDVLPIAVFGIDPEKMIVQCNDMAQDLFSVDGLSPIGTRYSEFFTKELNQLVDSLDSQNEADGAVVIKDKSYNAAARRIDSFMVVGLIPLDVSRE